MLAVEFPTISYPPMARLVRFQARQRLRMLCPRLRHGKQTRDNLKGLGALIETLSVQ
jgi:hypothetical protein